MEAGDLPSADVARSKSGHNRLQETIPHAGDIDTNPTELASVVFGLLNYAWFKGVRT